MKKQKYYLCHRDAEYSDGSGRVSIEQAWSGHRTLEAAEAAAERHERAVHARHPNALSTSIIAERQDDGTYRTPPDIGRN